MTLLRDIPINTYSHHDVTTMHPHHILFKAHPHQTLLIMTSSNIPSSSIVILIMTLPWRILIIALPKHTLTNPSSLWPHQILPPHQYLFSLWRDHDASSSYSYQNTPPPIPPRYDLNETYLSLSALIVIITWPVHTYLILSSLKHILIMISSEYLPPH